MLSRWLRGYDEATINVILLRFFFEFIYAVFNVKCVITVGSQAITNYFVEI